MNFDSVGCGKSLKICGSIYSCQYDVRLQLDGSIIIMFMFHLRYCSSIFWITCLWVPLGWCGWLTQTSTIPWPFTYHCLLNTSSSIVNEYLHFEFDLPSPLSNVFNDIVETHCSDLMVFCVLVSSHLLWNRNLLVQLTIIYWNLCAFNIIVTLFPSASDIACWIKKMWFNLFKNISKTSKTNFHS